ncbi:hypothetical protein FGF1_14920 [Flavobacteriaceae bacterium GF1]
MDRTNFIDVTKRGSLQKLPFKDNVIDLYEKDKYNYYLTDNFLRDSSVFIIRVSRFIPNKEKEYFLMKINRQSIVLDSMDLSPLGLRSVKDFFVSPNGDKAIFISKSDKGDGNNIIKIIDLIRKKEIFQQFVEQGNIYLYQNPWSSDETHVVLYNDLDQVFILEFQSRIISKTDLQGTDVMWLQGKQKLACLNGNNSIVVYDINTKKKMVIYSFKDFLLSPAIMDYYWFSSEEKFLIKYRDELKNLENKVWFDKELIIKYKCKDGK